MVGGESRAARRLSTMRLQRVESMELVEFPDTMEGLFGKVRWWALHLTLMCHQAALRTFRCAASTPPAE